MSATLPAGVVSVARTPGGYKLFALQNSNIVAEATVTLYDLSFANGAVEAIAQTLLNAAQSADQKHESVVAELPT